MGAADYFLTTNELAERCEVHRRTVFRWIGRPGFPQPVRRLGDHNRYDWPRVRSWLVERDLWDDVVDCSTGRSWPRCGGTSVQAGR